MSFWRLCVKEMTRSLRCLFRIWFLIGFLFFVFFFLREDLKRDKFGDKFALLFIVYFICYRDGGLYLALIWMRPSKQGLNWNPSYPALIFPWVKFFFCLLQLKIWSLAPSMIWLQKKRVKVCAFFYCRWEFWAVQRNNMLACNKDVQV